MNDIREGRVTCYMEDIQVLRSFGERQDSIEHALDPPLLGTGKLRQA